MAFLIFAISPFLLTAQYNPKALEKAEETIEKFKDKKPEIEAFFDDAYGYAVFPNVGKGASVVGGAFGNGTVFEQGKAIGKARLTQITVGFQLGGQAFRQIIFFETKADLERFKENRVELSAQASAVAIKEGASANIPYSDGVAVFTMTKGGLMYEASIGGQQFKFKPYKFKKKRQS